MKIAPEKICVSKVQILSVDHDWGPHPHKILITWLFQVHYISL